MPTHRGCPRRTLVASALAVASTLAACGDGSAGPTSGGGGNAPTRQGFAAAANAICVEAKKRMVEVQERTPDEPQDLRGGLQRARSELAREAARLAELPRPEGEAGELAQRWVEELGDRVEQTPAVVEPLVRAGEQEDPEAVREAAKRLQVLGNRGDTNALARRLGATECAE